ncbi:MAG: DUF1501 domain-containing protein [Planctomycetes bacterium]|nr:DUF1501 domain-containing protein [Planctomycetota bacterium]
MLSIQGPGSKLCDGVTRRELLRVGGLSLFGGLTLPRLLQARETGRRRDGRARSVIMFNLLGGPSHIDMFDMKPHAPAEIRGEFRPIATSLPGLQICELLPNLAGLMHKACLVRTFSHNFNSHDPLSFMTGYTDLGFLEPAKPSDPPDIGAVCQYLGKGPTDMPGAVCLPCYPGSGEGIRRRGPYGGFLGRQYNPLFARCQPTFERQPRRDYYDPVMPHGEPLLPSMDNVPDLTPVRFDARQRLLHQVDAALAGVSPAMERMDRLRGRALAMLTSGRARAAFDIAREPDRVRDRYGRNLYSSCLLVARRLVEAGVPFISVHQEIFGKNGHAYDMHENNFGMLRDFNLPLLDRCIPALVQDLDDRGMLDSTLVVVMGEMGRSPRVNRAAGRDHWPQCGFSLLFGGGIRPGTVYGASDRIGAYPASLPVSPADFVATIYHLLGIDPHLMVPDPQGRPIAIAHGGNAIRGLLA